MFQVKNTGLDSAFVVGSNEIVEMNEHLLSNEYSNACGIFVMVPSSTTRLSEPHEHVEHTGNPSALQDSMSG